MAARGAVTLEAVLAAVVRGRVRYLVPSPEQKRALREQGVHVETGVFGARMAVELVNDGPVTILLEV